MASYFFVVPSGEVKGREKKAVRRRIRTHYQRIEREHIVYVSGSYGMVPVAFRTSAGSLITPFSPALAACCNFTALTLFTLYVDDLTYSYSWFLQIEHLQFNCFAHHLAYNGGEQNWEDDLAL